MDLENDYRIKIMQQCQISSKKDLISARNNAFNDEVLKSRIPTVKQLLPYFPRVVLLRRLKSNKQANKQIDISRKLDDWLIDCSICPWANKDTSMNKDVVFSFDEFEKWCLKTKIHTFTHALLPLKSRRILIPRKTKKRKWQDVFESTDSDSESSESSDSSDSESSDSESESDNGNENSDNSSIFVHAPNLIPLLYEWMRKSEEKSKDDIDPSNKSSDEKIDLRSQETLTLKNPEKNKLKVVTTPTKDMSRSQERRSPDGVNDVFNNNLDFSDVFNNDCENQNYAKIDDCENFLDAMIEAGLSNSSHDPLPLDGPLDPLDDDDSLDVDVIFMGSHDDELLDKFNFL